MAIPLGIMGAVYLNEYGKKNRLANFIRFMADVMTGVPSVIMGVFIYSIWVVNFGVDGKSAFAASLALACLMLPIIVRSTEEMLRLVPGPPPRGVLRPRHPDVEDHAQRGAPRRPPRHHLRHAPRRRPGGRRDGPCRVHDRVRHHRPTGASPVRTRPLGADLFPVRQNGGSLATQLAWGAAVTLVGIVLVLTLTARFITRRLRRHVSRP